MATETTGDLDAAAALFEQAVAQNPGDIAAYNNLGVVRKLQGRLDEAIASFGRALAIDPDYVDGIVNLGAALRDRGRHDDAIACLRHAAALAPQAFGAHFNLGNAYFAKGDAAAAAASFQAALAIEPSHAGAYNNLGQALQRLGRGNEAIAAYRKALSIAPDDPAVSFNLILALKNGDQLDEAAECCRRLLIANPRSAEAHNNLGAVAMAQGRFDEALASYRRATAIKENYPEAQTNEAILLLLRGDFERGWPKYEWRLKRGGGDARHYAQPQWRGEPIAGKTILLHSEQGFGDTIQFMRYAAMVAAAGATVIVEVPSPLKDLAASLRAPVKILARDEALPPFDVYCPLGTLPRVFGTRADTIPAPIPYLFAKPATAARWREGFGNAPGLKVGLVWAGNPNHVNDHNRSVAIESLRSLLETAGIRWFSLQVGPCAKDLALLPPGLVTDLSTELTDFAETAGAIAGLDLVIAVDTAVVHLAGALGRPVWTMLPFVPDWRWQLERPDSPWYPSMRLFRQPASGDWQTVVANVKLELNRWVSGLAAAGGRNRPAKPDLQALLVEALRHHQAGALDQAEQFYRRMLLERPGHQAALANLGMVFHQRRALAEAETWYARALAAERTPEVLNNLATLRREQGDLAGAERLLAEVLTLRPDDPDGLYNLGLTLIDAGRPDEAVAPLSQRARDPQAGADIHANLARALHAAGRTPEALRYGRQALLLKDRQARADFKARGGRTLPRVPPPRFDPSHPERNVIAFSLWGTRATYVEGAIANARLATTVYPGWRCRIYLDDTVPFAAVDALRRAGAQLVTMPRSDGRSGLFWRFLAADDDEVSYFLCRDADSRINTQEAAAVAEWLGSGRPFHIMRDAPFHTELMLAGLWGGVGGRLRGIRTWIDRFYRANLHRWADQDFLRTEIWPRISAQTLIHDSFYDLFDARRYPAAGRLTAPDHVGAGFRL